MNKLIFTVLIGLALVSVGLAQGKDSLAVSIDKADSVVSASDTEKTIPDSLIFWKNGGSFNINIQQVGLKNWAAGGNASVAVGGRIEAFANYEEGDVVWENNFKAGYGVIRNGGVGNDFEKTDDLIILRSKYSQKFSERVLMSATVDFRTQMDRGFKNEAGQNGEQVRTLISDFMAPGYLQASLGLTFREEQVFRVTLAPFTGRFTFVLDSALSAAGAFGVEPNEKIRSEAGISLTGKYEKDIWENVKLQTNVNLFSNYEKFPNTVVNIEAALNLKVNDFISSNIATQLIYDDDVILTRDNGTTGRDIQLKNVINVGFTIGF